MTHPSPFLRIALLVLLFIFPPLLHAQRERLSPEEIEYIDKTWPGTKRTSTGIRYIIRKEGDAPGPNSGDKVGVLYVGTLLHGKKFDECKNPAEPFTFRVGREQVIDGWDQILPAMKLHEKRLVIVPSELAYGSRGHPPIIPRDATLVFEMELISVTPE